ncbi:MAG: glycine cleavage system aminomethyltransferase GcvT [Rhodospirillaceae bacterium]|jgi:aminomethyltransferase|nr:glycine cleavage system aminomethyltransferase GcvT [Rhodospirillaceae bacterium]
MSNPVDETLITTPLDSLHRELGARMVPFAGHSLPVQYDGGIIAEHTHTREKASLFDVSHMGQVVLSGENAVAELEQLVPGNIAGLAEGRIRYTMLTNLRGGIIDDLMVGNAGDHLRLVVNGARADVDLAHLKDHLGKDVSIDYRQGRALMALQGPKAAAVLTGLNSVAAEMPFMSFLDFEIAGKSVSVSRCGYTGEDGYEISTMADDAEIVARALLDHADVALAGLGARDSLRLEAGLCLYGQDITEDTTPIEAGLRWSMTKKRLEAGGFMGHATINAQAESGASRRLVGLTPEGRAPARPGVAILGPDGSEIGTITSGGFGATVGGPVALGYVPIDLAESGTQLTLQIRKSQVPAIVTALPFVPHRYFKPKA